jgi:sortase A
MAKVKQKLVINQRYALRDNKPVKTPRSRKSKITLVLLAAISIVSLFILILPYLPHLSFLFRRPKIDATPYHQAATTKLETGTVSAKPGNRLILPDIGVDTQIIEGRNIYVIGKNQGVWHETSQTNPTQPGNMVIAGHRFLYTATNGGWFYNLPELKTGERIYVRWNNVMYEYEVYNTRTVLPTQVDIRNPDPAVPNKLTMYTCYPLGSTAKRFVVEAKLLQ